MGKKEEEQWPELLKKAIEKRNNNPDYKPYDFDKPIVWGVKRYEEVVFYCVAKRSIKTPIREYRKDYIFTAIELTSGNHVYVVPKNTCLSVEDDVIFIHQAYIDSSYKLDRFPVTTFETYFDLLIDRIPDFNPDQIRVMPQEEITQFFKQKS